MKTLLVAIFACGLAGTAALAQAPGPGGDKAKSAEKSKAAEKSKEKAKAAEHKESTPKAKSKSGGGTPKQ